MGLFSELHHLQQMRNEAFERNRKQAEFFRSALKNTYGTDDVDLIDAVQKLPLSFDEQLELIEMVLKCRESLS